MFKISKLRLWARSRPRGLRLSAGAAMALGLMFALGARAPLESAAAGPLVNTKEGPVKGVIGNGVAQFLGIPYAEPPIGDLRWRPPKKHAPWSGVLQATAYGPVCAQSNLFGVFAGPANNNEDCLYLNVFTPNIDPAGREKLPVIVWIHGGGNVDGETPGYDGSKLAAQGHTVVVTMEYRLNVFGWLSHPALDNEGHLFGNYGLLDQQLVLKWVQRNIAQFGGDKNNVTVGGQSSGALNAALSMVSPLAKGLLHRVICQSYCPAPLLPGGYSTPLATAEARGVAFAVAAGCGSGTDAATAKCLRSLTAAQAGALRGNFTAGQGVVDGQIVPMQPMTAFATGQFNHVPLINGDVEDEQNFFLAITEYNSNTNNALRTPPTAEQYLAYVNNTFGTSAYPAGTPARILARYPLNAYATPQLVWDRVGTDASICGQRVLDKILAPQIPVYVYEFADQTAPFYFPKMPGLVSLAYHTSDIQYLFPLWSGGPSPPSIVRYLNNKQEKLSDQLVAFWANFAWTGNPNGQGNSPWPRYTTRPSKPAWLIQKTPASSTMTDAQYAALRNCDLWDSVVPPLP
ncbi:Carboxylesterase type B [Methylocella silvestris BL2]|uniref:Carboxylic ester hydrolase n=1 Tax=Methylocella silvestris (strain DSM 15510 / CIP 108128 / LMG 27833 / NCIMB 13906 / BL2) TaxID=395965 RepID=B8ER80_METSB|nr:carboxylesterase family protein [Methylocella silvestris]ACK50264.1 Carboxylesterase type B [Methylocella silvestris BL2]